MARWQLFGSLVLVPSQFLNMLQEAVYAQRANGAVNTTSLALDNNMTSFDQRLIQFAPDASVVLVASPVVVDSSISWLDRNITVRWKFDSLRDIRPGKADDYKQAEFEGDFKVYVVPGARNYKVCSQWGLIIQSGSNQLMFYKQAGYLHVEIESGTQLKER